MMNGNGSGEGSSTNAVGGDVTGGMKKGPWTAAEDNMLIDYVKMNGEGNWNAVQKNTDLARCGKSCRLRWANHLRPNLKKGSFTPEEERIILELHSKIGNKWARMATQLPGRTDNEIKNYWNTRIKRRQRSGLPIYPPDIQHRHNGFLYNQNCQIPLARPNETKSQFGRGNPLPRPLHSNQTSLSLLDPFPMGLSNHQTMAMSIPQPNMISLQQQQHQYQHHVRQPPTVFPNSEGQSSFSRVQHLKRLRNDTLEYPGIFNNNSVSTAVPMGVPIVRFKPILPSGSLMHLQRPPQQQHQSSHLMPMKMELPSNQFLPASVSNHNSDPWIQQANNNSGLLEALLEDTQVANRRVSPEYIEPTDEKTSEYKKMKIEPLEINISESEDLSAFFDLINETNASSSSPSQATTSKWVKNECGEASGVTEEDLIDMQQLSSCIPKLSLEENDPQNWNQWDDTSGTNGIS